MANRRTNMARKFDLRITSVVLLASALVAALAAFTRISLAENKPHFAGKWNFNQDQSDDASQKVHDAEASVRNQRGGYPGGGGPQGGGYPSGGGYPGGGGGYPGGGGIGFPRGGIGGGPMGGGRVGRGGPPRGGGADRGSGLSGEDLTSWPRIRRCCELNKTINKSPFLTTRARLRTCTQTARSTRRRTRTASRPPSRLTGMEITW